MPLDADPSSPNANAYCDLDFAVAYFQLRLGAGAWFSAANDDLRSAAIVTATQWLEQLNWRGTRTDPDQTLKWPRANVATGDRVADVTGGLPSKTYDETVIPAGVKQACCELALLLLENPAYGGTDGLERFTTAGISQGDSVGIRHGANRGLPRQVTRLLGDFLASYGGTVMRN
jgi:hypothetical protein